MCVKICEGEHRAREKVCARCAHSNAERHEYIRLYPRRGKHGDDICGQTAGARLEIGNPGDVNGDSTVRRDRGAELSRDSALTRLTAR